MRKMLVVLLLSIALPWSCAPARAQSDHMLVGRSDDGKVTVRLFPSEPCAPEVLKFIPPPLRGEFRGGRATFDGTDYRACFALPGDGSVVLVYEDGESGRVPMGVFQNEKRI